jgi:sugar phosphate isomerase/epimerase
MRQLGISTCFFNNKEITAYEMMENTIQWGCNSLELEYRISREHFEIIKKNHQKYDLEIVSLHNFCYRPEHIPLSEADADYYRLSAHDEDERKKAVSYTLETIKNAAEIGAGYVVLHLGDSGQNKEKPQFQKLAARDMFTSPQSKEYLKQYRLERNTLAPAGMDSICKSLDEIIPFSERQSITLGIENRYYIHQYPDYEEMDLIFKKYSDAPLGLWLDFGHAQVKEVLGEHGIMDFLKRYKSKLLGCHIHDVKKIEDHLPPGKGDLNFISFKEYLKDDTVLILEIRSKHSNKDFIAGVDTIKKALSL